MSVQVGDSIASTQWKNLADRINRLILLGVGDPSWRIHYAIESIVHAIRNPDASGTQFPPEHEALSIYAMLSHTDGSWPVAAPGTPEGANVANSIAAFIFGSEAAGLNDEATRLTAFNPPQSIIDAEDAWNIAKTQRGGYDSSVPELRSPWFDLSLACKKVLLNDVRRDRTFGGLLPGMPISDVPCDDPDIDDGQPPPVNYIVRFLPLKQGLPVIEFAGTCQPGPDIDPPDKYDEHVAAIAPDVCAGLYYVYKNNGTVQVISMADYILDRSGPPHWSGASLWGILYALQWYACSFRGTSEYIGNIIAGTLPDGDPLKPWLSGAFDFERFYTSQFPLAPAKGVYDRNTDTMSIEYPRWDLPGMATPHAISNGFVLAGWYASASTSDYVIVGLEIDGTVVDTMRLTTGQSKDLRYFSSGYTGTVVPVVLEGTYSSLAVEVAELWPYKPQPWDAYALLRLLSYQS